MHAYESIIKAFDLETSSFSLSQTSVAKMSELADIKSRYERVLVYNDFRLNITARYRMRSTNHDSGDIVVVFKFEPNESSKDGLCEAVLLALEQALDEFLESLKKDYDQSEDRMIFVSVYSEAFINGALYMGEYLISYSRVWLFKKIMKLD